MVKSDLLSSVNLDTEFVEMAAREIVSCNSTMSRVLDETSWSDNLRTVLWLLNINFCQTKPGKFRNGPATCAAVHQRIKELLSLN